MGWWGAIICAPRWQFQPKRCIMDWQDEVIKLVGDTAEVAPEYGGYEITVEKPGLFPWHAVLDLLIETGHEVWITKKDGKISINTEPKVE